jgi:hypothetical protein
MSNKTTKKNKAPLEWPSNVHFTMKDLFSKYPTPDYVEITIRFRVKRGLEDKDIVTIGKIKPAIGRPLLVFARANPSKELLEAAKAAGVIPLDDRRTSLPVGDVKVPVAKTEVTPTTKIMATPLVVVVS